MGIKYSSLNVDERYSSIFAPMLYRNTVLVPGVTYTDKYMDGPAGGVYVHKLTSTSPLSPEAPAKAFSHTDIADTLVPILLNNTYRKSEIIYQVQANAVSAPVATTALENATQQARQGRDLSAVSCLITEGTTSSSTSAIAAGGAIDALLNERAAASAAVAGSASIVLASPAFMGKLISEALGKFTPTYNDALAKSGARVLDYLDYHIIECNMLSLDGAATYYDSTGSLKTVAKAALNAVDFIMYNPEAFAVLDNLNAFRLVDGAPNYLGTLAQVEVNTGFKVTNSECVRVRKTTA